MKYKLFTIFSLIYLFGITDAKASEFNPNHIISDAELQSYQGFRVQDVQNILKNKNSYLANFFTQDINLTTKSAAEIIYNASQTYRISPKYIITTLQKEQSLITGKSPTQDQLDWATGYGICDSCSKQDPSLQKYRGFGKQVDSSAGIMRWYYDNTDKSFVKVAGNTYNISNTIVTPTNNATAFLYTYTPHILGNKNFWNIWKNWFGAKHPDGTLLEDKNGQIYLIEGGKRRFVSTNTFDLRNYNLKNRISVPDLVLSEYEAGANIDNQGHKFVFWSGGYFLVENNTVYRFDSAETMDYHGFIRNNIPVISDSEFGLYKVGSAITKDILLPQGGLVRLKNTDTYYYIKMNKLYPIMEKVIIKANYALLDPIVLPPEKLASLELVEPVKLLDGTIFGVMGYNKIYVVEYGKKRPIVSEEAFNSYGYNWNSINWVSPITDISHPIGEPLTGITALMKDSVISTTVSNTLATQNKKMQTIPIEKNTFVGDKIDTTLNNYLIADENGIILAGKNIDEERPLASLTKIMTAYRLYAEGIDLTIPVIYNSKTHRSTYHRFRIAEGESYYNRDLMFSFLISSLNTPGKMLVSTVEKKSETNFVKRMNEQAKNWGLKNTSFVDVTGESTANIGTTRDYLTIFMKSTDNIDVRYFAGKANYEYYERVDKDGKPHHYDTHTNELVAKSSILPYHILASKTGYLDEAGNCLAMLIERKSDGKKLYIITMGNGDNNKKFAEPERLSQIAINKY